MAHVNLSAGAAVSAAAAVLCADIGTSSLKAALVTADGRILSFSQQYFSSQDSAPNSAHSAACGIAREWLPALCRAAAECLSGLHEQPGSGSLGKLLAGICISGNGPTIVGGDGTTFLWNEPLPPDAASCSATSLFLPRICAFRKLFPDVWTRCGRIFSGPEYLIRCLSGAEVTILPDERYIPAYWNADALAADLIPDDKLPAFVAPGTPAGVTTPQVTQMLGLEEPVPVFCGAPDFIVALTGTGTLRPGAVCDCAGSSEGLNLCTDRPLTGPRIRTLPSVVPGLWNAGVLFTSSGRLFSAYKERLQQQTGTALSFRQLAVRCIREPESEGGRILRKLAEEIKEAFAVLQEAAEKAGITVEPYIAITGGQAKTDEWMQFKADTVGYPFAVMNCADAELTGNAVFVWQKLGVYGSVADAAAGIVKKSKIFYPNCDSLSNS